MMPKAKMFPYPLKPGTHVVAKVRRLDLSGDEIIAGTIVRVLSAHARSATVTYAIQTKSGATVEALASRTTPIDTTSIEGLDQWLDALDEPEPVPGILPAPESIGAESLRMLLERSIVAPPRSSPYVPPGQIWYQSDTGPYITTNTTYDSLTDTYTVSSYPPNPAD